MRTFWTVFKWILGIGLVLAIVVGGVTVFLYPSVKKMIEQRASSAGGTQVRVQPASRGRLVRTISAPGVVDPRTKVSISSRVSAEIIELPFREGDVVKPGDIVVRLADREFLAQVESAEANVKADQARLEGSRAAYVNAVAEWERQEALFSTSDVSKSLLDKAISERDQLQSSLRAAEHAIEMSQARLAQAVENLRYTTMTSPISGRVTKLNAEVGEVVVTGTMNNAGTVILEIADLQDMLVKAEIAESDIAPVRAGQTSRIFINAYPEETFEGVVERVALQHSEKRDGTKYYETEVRLLLSGDRTIPRGLTANVDIEIETMEGVMLAPSQAVVDIRVDELPPALQSSPAIDQEKVFARVVYVLLNGKAVARPIRIGPSDLTKTVVLQGLEDGEELIVGPWSIIRGLKHDQMARKMEEKKPGEGETSADGAQPTVAGAEAEGERKATEAATKEEAPKDADKPKKEEKDAPAASNAPRAADGGATAGSASR